MSTDHQKYSTENQADAIRHYAASRGIEIVRTYADDGKSGLSIDGRASLQRLIAELTYKHHPHGGRLQDEVLAFATDFREAGILKKSTDPVRFARHITQDVLS